MAQLGDQRQFHHHAEGQEKSPCRNRQGLLNGRRNRIRTCDRSIKSRMLYQLSYAPAYVMACLSKSSSFRIYWLGHHREARKIGIRGGSVNTFNWPFI